MSDEPILVLLVEDNEDHADVLKRNLREADHFSRLMTALSRYWTVGNATPQARHAPPGLPA